MSASRPSAGSFVIPDSEQMGIFRCGACWGTTHVIYHEIVEDGIITRLTCCACGNYQEWSTPWNGQIEEEVSGNDS